VYIRVGRQSKKTPNASFTSKLARPGSAKEPQRSRSGSSKREKDSRDQRSASGSRNDSLKRAKSVSSGSRTPSRPASGSRTPLSRLGSQKNLLGSTTPLVIVPKRSGSVKREPDADDLPLSQGSVGGLDDREYVSSRPTTPRGNGSSQWGANTPSRLNHMRVEGPSRPTTPRARAGSLPQSGSASRATTPGRAPRGDRERDVPVHHSRPHTPHRNTDRGQPTPAHSAMLTARVRPESREGKRQQSRQTSFGSSTPRFFQVNARGVIPGQPGGMKVSASSAGPLKSSMKGSATPVSRPKTPSRSGSSSGSRKGSLKGSEGRSREDRNVQREREVRRPPSANPTPRGSIGGPQAPIAIRGKGEGGAVKGLLTNNGRRWMDQRGKSDDFEDETTDMGRDPLSSEQVYTDRINDSYGEEDPERANAAFYEF